MKYAGNDITFKEYIDALVFRGVDSLGDDDAEMYVHAADLKALADSHTALLAAAKEMQRDLSFEGYRSRRDMLAELIAEAEKI